jgi:hypothetical protein
MINGCQPQKDPVVHGFAGVANVTSGDEDALVSASCAPRISRTQTHLSRAAACVQCAQLPHTAPPPLSVANYPVISIGIDASSDDFQLYGGGVYAANQHAVFTLR